MTSTKTAVPIYQIKITLQHSKPPIWRRLLVSSDMTLGRLHHTIQAAMDWTDSHLHQFIVGGVYYGEPSPEDWQEIKDERRVRLSRLVTGEKFKFIYEYDFGDDWLHAIVIEKILPPDPDQKLPVCLKGKRACPPEDVGGMWGYADFLEAIKDPENEEHDSWLEWVGGEFDPEAFNLDQVNARLRMLS